MSRPRAPAPRRRSSRANIAIHLILICGVLYATLPGLWGLSTSLKSPTDVSAYPPRWIPQSLYLGNYDAAFIGSKFSRYVWNSIVVTAGVTVVSLLFASHAAYAASRYQFRGRTALLLIMLATSMIPAVATIVPLYLLSVQVGLYDTNWALIIVYSAWLIPALVWLLKGFVDGVPREVEEAALIDGCSLTGTFYRIDLPLMAPGLAAGAVLAFATVWNDFLWAFSLTLSDSHRLVQVGLYFFITEAEIQWGPLMAATIGALLPIVLAFALMQRAFIRGLTGGSVVG